LLKTAFRSTGKRDVGHTVKKKKDLEGIDLDSRFRLWYFFIYWRVSTLGGIDKTILREMVSCSFLGVFRKKERKKGRVIELTILESRYSDSYRIPVCFVLSPFCYTSVESKRLMVLVLPGCIYLRFDLKFKEVISISEK
jgi:hypothetical protein